jgi:hypothetical protein
MIEANEFKLGALTRQDFFSLVRFESGLEVMKHFHLDNFLKRKRERERESYLSGEFIAFC